MTAPSSPSPLVIDVLQQFRLIFGSLRQHFRLVEQRCGMSGSQMWVLQEIERAPAIGVSQLATRMGIHQSTCSLLVEKLVQQDCVIRQRAQADQRRVGLWLAPKGSAALATLPGPAEGILPEALSELPEAVLKILHINLSEVIHHLSEKDESYALVPLADLLDRARQRPDPPSTA